MYTTAEHLVSEATANLTNADRPAYVQPDGTILLDENWADDRAAWSVKVHADGTTSLL